MFGEREVKCEVCGKLLATYGCIQPANINDSEVCDSCKKAIEDATEQAKYLRDKK